MSPSHHLSGVVLLCLRSRRLDFLTTLRVPLSNHARFMSRQQQQQQQHDDDISNCGNLAPSHWSIEAKGPENSGRKRQLKYDHTSKPCNLVFGPGNTLGSLPATRMTISISMRRRAAAAAAGPYPITTAPFPVNHVVPRPTAPAPASAFPPAKPGLNVFSAEEQTTIRSFLSAVWMSEEEGLSEDGLGYAATLDADIEARIATLERMRTGERALLDRIQVLVTSPHNFGRIFSSPAPRLVLAVGSVGPYFKTYEECDTFLRTDAGLHWTMVSKETNKYEFGDQGSIMVLVNDEDGVDEVRYSSDPGRTWKSLKLQYRIRARALTTVPDSTSQKFMFVASSRARTRLHGQPLREVVHAQWGQDECIMGHKQWYRRRKLDADCYLGHKFDDPVEHEEDCPCTNEDCECDYNFIRNGDQCLPAEPEPIPADVCRDASGTYVGSSGYRLIPGNTCNQSRGIVKDAKVQKDCSLAHPEEGEVTHQTFEFASEIVQYAYFKESTTILVRLHDGPIWQSSNEGYTWMQLFPDERFIVFYLHSYSNDRAYILTSSQKY
ncbi:hypothetical protein DFH11DRAFT_1818260 [Phellopilus nigrolimitatus]|nr:hypothetical protein DFH11DRAFT_1818260 [Phellopilus nigrolimitatus]